MENLPNRASDSGPENRPVTDWREKIDDARDNAMYASRAEFDLRYGNERRIRLINAAIEDLERAKELLR